MCDAKRMSEAADRFRLSHLLARLLPASLLLAAAAALPAHRFYGVDGLVALFAVAALSLVITIVPALLVKPQTDRPTAETGAALLKVTALRMGLFLVFALSVFFGSTDELREPAVLAFTGFHLASLAVETVCLARTAPQNASRNTPKPAEDR